MAEFIIWLENARHWGWGIFGIFLVVLEIFAPGAVFLWMGIAAFIVGLGVFIWPEIEWRYQLLLFAALSVASVFVARRYLRSNPIQTDRPTLNRRGTQYIDRIFTLGTPIVDGRGNLHVDDTMWKIQGPELDAGVKVRVTGVDGVMLTVEPYDPEAP
ncbi:MAG: NfeD family protein [Alphaproteobacteria bacterium]|nr:NfeD family protein [Alphaproteobacteria bacterium]